MGIDSRHILHKGQGEGGSSQGIKERDIPSRPTMGGKILGALTGQTIASMQESSTSRNR